MLAVARAPNPFCLMRTRIVDHTDALLRVIARNEAIQKTRYNTLLTPLAVIAGLIRDLLHPWDPFTLLSLLP